MALLATCFHAGLVLGLFFYIEDGGDTFLRNVAGFLWNYTALRLRLSCHSLSVLD
jgi:hypothetical protein